MDGLEHPKILAESAQYFISSFLGHVYSPYLSVIKVWAMTKMKFMLHAR